MAVVLVVPGAVYDAMVDAAIEAAPAEAVGVLCGTLGDGTSRVTGSESVGNAAADPRRRYAVETGEQYSAMERCRADGGDVVGFYHSHPAGPAAPSGIDADRAAWPRRSHVIVSLATAHPVVGSWRWDGDRERFVREAIRVR